MSTCDVSPSNVMREEFEARVREYLKPLEGRFNYDLVLGIHLNNCRFGRFVDDAAMYHPIEGSTVFSSGCGSGGDLEMFLDRGASRVVGIEVDPELARLARLRLSSRGFEGGWQVDVYSGEALPYPDECFDIAMSLHVIEHVAEPAAYLADLIRVLKPGGLLFLDVPNRHYFWEQHTGLPLIHMLPTPIRRMLSGLMLSRPIAPHLSADLRLKLQGIYYSRFDWPGDYLRDACRVKGGAALAWREVSFHSNDGLRMSAGPWPRSHLWGPARRKTTFRMVAQKL